MRAAYEAAFTLHDWEPAYVWKGSVGDAGVGLYHRRCEYAVWRTKDNRYVRDSVRPRQIEVTTWDKITNGLFWTTVDYFTRKNIWHPDLAVMQPPVTC